MKPQQWQSMSAEELWFLHEQVVSVLVRKIAEEKARLDERLRRLKSDAASTSKRPYRRVYPKYQNPARPDETWAGKGRKPRWLMAQLRSGRKLDDFLIQPS